MEVDEFQKELDSLKQQMKSHLVTQQMNHLRSALELERLIALMEGKNPPFGILDRDAIHYKVQEVYKQMDMLSDHPRYGFLWHAMNGLVSSVGMDPRQWQEDNISTYEFCKSCEGTGLEKHTDDKDEHGNNLVVCGKCQKKVLQMGLHLCGDKFSYPSVVL